MEVSNCSIKAFDIDNFCIRVNSLLEYFKWTLTA